jgi:hypothetical protein
MMALDVIIDVHPERIYNRTEAEDALLKIRAFESSLNCKAGVVIKQNKQLGGSYRIVSEKEATKGIENPGKYEWYIKFYPKSFFEEKLKEYSR